MVTAAAAGKRTVAVMVMGRMAKRTGSRNAVVEKRIAAVVAMAKRTESRIAVAVVAKTSRIAAVTAMAQKMESKTAVA